MKRILLILFVLVQITPFLWAQTTNPALKSSKKYVPIKVEEHTIQLKDSKIELDKNGFPKQIYTFYRPTQNPTKILFENIHFHVVRKSDSKNILLKDGGVKFAKNDKKTDRWNGIVKWKSSSRNDSLVMEVVGKAKFDGQLTFNVKIMALQAMALKEVTMHIPFVPTLPSIMMGFGVNEGKRPEKVEWKWDGPFKNETGAWLGNEEAGLRYVLKKGAWANENRGGVTVGLKGSSMLANNYTGEHEMKKGDVRYYNFMLFIKPLHGTKR